MRPRHVLLLLAFLCQLPQVLAAKPKPMTLPQPPPPPPPNPQSQPPPASVVPRGQAYSLIGAGVCASGAGAYLIKTQAPTLDDCFAQCVGSSACKAFEYSAPNRMCALRAGFVMQALGDVPPAPPTQCFVTCAILANADFAQGTVRIQTPQTCVMLKEDIEFEPNQSPWSRTDTDLATWMFPTAAQLQSTYNSRAYLMGFFAALTVETSQVLVDLNTFTIKQGKFHNLMQRFYANIELSSQTFPPGQGPFDFGSSMNASDTVWIKNGHIGLSSHHGIKGNNNQRVVLSELEVFDYEVTGVHFNAPNQLRVENVVIGSTVRTLPWNYRLTNLLLAYRVAVLAGQAQTVAAVDALQDLKDVIDAHAQDLPIPAPYATEVNGLPDSAMCAGLVVHPLVNVGPSLDNASEVFAHNVVLRNVRVHDVSCSPDEIAALFPSDSSAAVSGYQSAAVHDVIGAVLIVDDVLAADGLTYAPTRLSEIQVALARLNVQCQAQQCPAGVSAVARSVLARTTITAQVLEWAAGQITFAALAQFPPEVAAPYTIRANHDIMHHYAKGAIGIKLEGVSNLQAQNIVVTGIENHATDRARLVELFDMTGASPFLGFDARGLVFSCDFDVTQFELFNVSGVWSAEGFARPFDVLNCAGNVQMTVKSVGPIPSSGALAGLV
jgi:HAMP domain-containing protein